MYSSMIFGLLPAAVMRVGVEMRVGIAIRIYAIAVSIAINETFSIEHRGGRLNYNVRGDRPPVLLIQGVGVHGDGWRPQVDELAAR